MKKSGKKFSNAEMDIDLEKEEVKFCYPHKEYNENLLFFFNSFYIRIGVIVGGMCGFIFPAYDPYGITPILFMPLYGLGGIILFGYISLFIHKYSKAARDSFPKTNAIFHSSQKFKINLEHKISRIHKVEGNKLIIFNYDIVYFKYCYIGFNKIKRIITKSVDYKAQEKGTEHTEFIATFIFKKPIKDGFLYYKTNGG